MVTVFCPQPGAWVPVSSALSLLALPRCCPLWLGWGVIARVPQGFSRPRVFWSSCSALTDRVGPVRCRAGGGGGPAKETRGPGGTARLAGARWPLSVEKPGPSRWEADGGYLSGRPSWSWAVSASLPPFSPEDTVAGFFRNLAFFVLSADGGYKLLAPPSRSWTCRRKLTRTRSR